MWLPGKNSNKNDEGKRREKHCGTRLFVQKFRISRHEPSLLYHPTYRVNSNYLKLQIYVVQSVSIFSHHMTCKLWWYRVK